VWVMYTFASRHDVHAVFLLIRLGWRAGCISGRASAIKGKGRRCMRAGPNYSESKWEQYNIAYHLQYSLYCRRMYTRHGSARAAKDIRFGLFGYVRLKTVRLGDKSGKHEILTSPISVPGICLVKRLPLSSLDRHLFSAPCSVLWWTRFQQAKALG
jgi:hypothetical protein